jgi:cytochrome c-type biogenesis protein CcmH/NrfF
MMTRRSVLASRGSCFIRYFVLLVAVLAAFSSTPIAAQPAVPAAPAVAVTDSALEAQTRAVSAQLRCPVCQGLSLADSPSELAQEMKDIVREQLAQGRTPDEVTQFFVGKYGEWILLQPEASGFNLVVYLLPLLAILVGAALLVIVVRKWTAHTDDPKPRALVQSRRVEGIELDGHDRLPQAIP